MRLGRSGSSGGATSSCSESRNATADQYEHDAHGALVCAGTGHATKNPAEAMVGERILGRFTLSERIGSGGFGTVYRAWDERLQRAVAVKVIDQEGEPRVMREAQAVARLGHRNIATLYELASENGRAYLV